MTRLMLLAFAWLFLVVGAIQFDVLSELKAEHGDPAPGALPPGCTREHELVVRRAFHSNLGGLGPDLLSPDGIMYGDVFPFSGKTIDMEVRNMSVYEAVELIEQNGNVGAFGSVRVNGEGVLLRFRFLDRQTGALVTVPDFLMTLFVSAVEAGDDESGGLQITIPNATAHYTSQNSTVSVTNDHQFFTHEPLLEPDHMAFHLEAKDEDAALTVLVPGASVFYMALNLAGGASPRDLLFAGESNLVCPDFGGCDTLECPDGFENVDNAMFLRCQRSECTVELDRSTCCKATQEMFCNDHSLLYVQPDSVLFSNIGGLGPDAGKPAGMLLGNVFPFSGFMIDLFIENTSMYTSPNVTKNTVTDTFGDIFISGPDSVVRFNFAFVNRTRQKELEPQGETSPTGALANITWPFFTSFYGLTRSPSGSCKKSVRSTSAAGSRVTTTTGVAAEDGFFGPIRYGSPIDTSTDLRSQEDTDFAVGFTFEPASSFEVELKVVGCESGSNFFFAGQASRDDAGSGADAQAGAVGNKEDLVCETRATCGSMTCPPSYLKLVHANSTLCRGAECSDEDVSTCCAYHSGKETKTCSSDWALDVRDVIYSNLGGLGPDFHKPTGILFGNVFPLSGYIVDLEITNISEYLAAKTIKNGMSGLFGCFNIKSTSSSMLRWRFIDRRTKRPTTPGDPFRLTFFDFDQMMRDRCKERLQISHVLEYTLEPETTVAAEQTESSDHIKSVTFTSTTYGLESDNPFTPMLLSPTQKRKAVSVLIDNVPEFMVLAVITKGWAGRNFLFSGPSSMNCAERASCSSFTCPGGYSPVAKPEAVLCMDAACSMYDLSTCCVEVPPVSCDDGMELRLSEKQLMYSNLGALGPDTTSGMEGIRFSDVFPTGNQTADLIIENTSVFVPGKQNGASGHFGVLSINGSSNVNLTFKFVARGTDTPVTVAPFFLTFANLGRSQEGVGGLRLKVATGFNNFHFSSPEYLQKVGDVFSVQETSPVMSSEPKEPLALLPEEASYAVSFQMPKGDHFRVQIAVDEGPPHSLLFAGSSTLTCPGRASCESYACPEAMISRELPAQLRCASSVCTDAADAATCCAEPEETTQEQQTMQEVCKDDARLRLSTSKVVYSNLGGLGPDFGYPAKLVFGDVAPGSGRLINMEVSNTTLYRADDITSNGLMGTYAGVNMLSDQSVTLRFRFVDGEAEEPVNMPKFYFTVLELSQEKYGCQCGLDYTLAENLRLQIFHKSVAALTACAERPPKGIILDRASGALLQGPAGHTLGFAVPSTDEFVVEIGALPDCTSRNVLFAGVMDEQCQAVTIPSDGAKALAPGQAGNVC